MAVSQHVAAESHNDLHTSGYGLSMPPSPDDFRVFIDPAGHPFCLVRPWRDGRSAQTTA